MSPGPAGAGGRVGLWVAGARPRTLGAAVAPVLVGTAVASRSQPVVAWRALAALVVALALQVGVNYANDYSDGRRGVDARRQGPLRLTASGAVAAEAVRRAAAIAFAVGAVAGLALSVAVDWRLAAVGAAAIVAAMAYAGGPRPYASLGLGEVMVMVFFGFVATCGSAYVQLGSLPGLAVAASVPVGLGACAILLVNNLRDLPTDEAAGKITLAVRLGGPATRAAYVSCVVGALGGAIVHPAALVAAPLAVEPCRLVLRADSGPPALVRALKGTAAFQLTLGAALAVGLWLW